MAWQKTVCSRLSWFYNCFTLAAPFSMACVGFALLQESATCQISCIAFQISRVSVKLQLAQDLFDDVGNPFCVTEADRWQLMVVDGGKKNESPFYNGSMLYYYYGIVCWFSLSLFLYWVFVLSVLSMFRGCCHIRSLICVEFDFIVSSRFTKATHVWQMWMCMCRIETFGLVLNVGSMYIWWVVNVASLLWIVDRNRSSERLQIAMCGL